jgi:hypothetical protein
MARTKSRSALKLFNAELLSAMRRISSVRKQYPSISLELSGYLQLDGRVTAKPSEPVKSYLHRRTMTALLKDTTSI